MQDDIYYLVNKPSDVEYCKMIVFANGEVRLQWWGKKLNTEGFPTVRAAKMYVSKHISTGKSTWAIKTI